MEGMTRVDRDVKCFLVQETGRTAYEQLGLNNT